MTNNIKRCTTFSSDPTNSSNNDLHNQIVEIVYNAITNIWFQVVVVNSNGTDNLLVKQNDGNYKIKIDDDGQKTTRDNNDGLWSATNNMILLDMVRSSVSVWDNDAGKEFYDIEIRTATSLFHRYKTKQTQQRNNDLSHEVEEPQDEQEHSSQKRAERKKQLKQIKGDIPPSNVSLKDFVLDEVSPHVEDGIAKKEEATTTTGCLEKPNCRNYQTKKRRNRQQDPKANNNDSPGPFVLVVRSSYGVERTFHSSYDFAQCLVAPIEDMCYQWDISYHIRVAMSSGFICICAKQKILSITGNRFHVDHDNNHSMSSSDIAEQLEPCPYCPNWCKGTKGLWWHIQQYHKVNYSIANSFNPVQRDQLAIIVYDNNNNVVNNINNSNVTAVSNNENPLILRSATLDNTLIDQHNGTITTSNLAPETNQKPPKTSHQLTKLSLRNDLFNIVKTGDLNRLKDIMALLQVQIREDDNDRHPDNNLTFVCRESILDDKLKESPPNKYSFDKFIDPNGSTILLWAAGYGYVSIVQYLIENDYCHINFQQTGKRSFNGRTALHWACRNGQYDTVQYLLSYAMKSTEDDSFVDDRKKSGTELIYNDYVIAMKRQESMKSGRLDLEATTSDGTTAFCWAAWQGHLSILKLLHHYGCNAQTINSYGCNAILWAAQGTKTGHHLHNNDNVKMIKNGEAIQANQIKDNKIKSFQHRDKDSEEDATLLESERNSLCHTFHIVPIEVQVIDWLESIGCHVFIVNHSGHGVLHKAAQRGHISLCQWYMNQCIMPNWQSHLDRACMVGAKQDEKTRYDDSDLNLEGILPSSINVDWVREQLQLIAPDHDGCTPSDLAGMEHYIDLAVFLSQYEETMIRMTFQLITNYSAWDSAVPEWLQLRTLPARNEVEHMLFEPWAGLNRMRSIWTTLLKRKSSSKF